MQCGVPFRVGPGRIADDPIGEHVLSSGDILRFAVPLRVGVRGDVHRVTNASVHRR